MQNGKDEPGYMRACVLAARRGFVALMFDPHAQGERRWNRTLRVGSHNEMALRANLIDWSGPLLRIWDGIRAIDYVASRPEVDAQRIGYMGQSGGGTMTALIMAVDERVKAAAPSCYLTSLRRLCDVLGPQDGEQSIYGQLSFGLNHTGYVLIPDIPVAVTCKFADMFPYSGVMTLMNAVRSVEKSAGLGERTLLNHFSGPHGWTEASRVASVEFLAKHLISGHSGDVVRPEKFWRFDLDPTLDDGDIGIQDESERGCCEGRTTESLPGSRSIIDIIAARALGFRDRWKARSPAETAEMVRRVAKIKMPSESPRFVMTAGTNTIEDFAAQNIVVQCPKTGHMLPALFFALTANL